MNLRVAAIGLLLFCVGCNTTDAGKSQVKFAFYPAATGYSGMIGRIELIKQKFNVDFPTLVVCVGPGSGGYTDKELLLDTKLAYAAWVDGAKQYQESDWKAFQFVQKPACLLEDKTVAALVTIGEPVGPPSGFEFVEAVAECTRTKRASSCAGNRVTLGYGGIGGVSYQYYPNEPDKWVKVVNVRAAVTALNPHVVWQSITAYISNNTDFSPSKKRELTEHYETLLNRADPSYEELTTFFSVLKAEKLVDVAPNEMQGVVDRFAAGSTSHEIIPFKMHRTTLSTLLHEIGHQFALDHAHDPAANSVTGGSEINRDLEGRVVENFRTDLSVMAYSLPYLHLTDDDILGVKNLAHEVSAFLVTRHP
jgi:hypothetical protein